MCLSVCNPATKLELLSCNSRYLYLQLHNSSVNCAGFGDARSELGRRVYLVKYGVNGFGDNLRGKLKTDATDYKYAFYPSLLEASHIREYINYVRYGFPQHWVRACGASPDVHRVLRLNQTQSLNQKPALLHSNLLYQKLGTRLWNTSRASHDIIWA
jgi:hypothetical protein